MLAAVLSLSKHVYNTAKLIDWRVIYRRISKMLYKSHLIPYITLKLFQDMEQQCWMESCSKQGVQPLRTNTDDRL